MINQAQFDKIAKDAGFIAALDQSGGSTPKALGLYGVSEDAYSNEEEMFSLIHEMRTRIIKAPAFQGDKVIGAILFERTMDGTIDGVPVAEYIWNERGVVPFLKIDQGLEEEVDGVKLMKPMTKLDGLLERGSKAGIFGTKMRSVIESASETGIQKIVDQQFEIGAKVCAAGMVPILEPEVNIHAEDKEAIEEILLKAILAKLDELKANDGPAIMLKLTLPTVANKYKPLIEHEKVVRVVALSGGYDRELANEKLAANNGMIASFSRALSEGLSAQQSDEEFNAMVGNSIENIYQASAT